SLADLLLFLFEPKRGSRTIDLQNEQFWNRTDKVKQLLQSWTHSHQTSGKKLVVDWMVDFVGSKLHLEAQNLTTVSKMCFPSGAPEGYYLKNFKISHIQKTLETYCPVTIQILLDFSTTTRQRRRLGQVPESTRVVMYTICALLRQYSNQNNLTQTCLTLLMYGIGLQRQGFDILSHLGVLISYTSLVRGQETTIAWRKRGLAGPLKTLSAGCRQQAKDLWRAHIPCGVIFDNINLVFKVAQQGLGHTNSQENGTCATLFELHKPTPRSLDRAIAKSAFLKAGPLKIEHIIHNQEEKSDHRQLMIHAIARVIVKTGGEYFNQYQSLLDASQFAPAPVIDVHTTNIYPLPAMEIDESSINGVISVMDAIFAELEVDQKCPEFLDSIQLVAGDLKSGSNLLSAKESRSGHEETHSSLGNLEYVLGLFHTKIAAVLSVFTTHLGSPTAGKDNPGSLLFHNEVLGRNPIVISSPPPFAVSKDLIMDSLAARVLHCVFLETDCETLAEYIAHLESHGSTSSTKAQAQQMRWKQLLCDSTRVYNKYVNIEAVASLQSSRLLAEPGEKAGDMVYEGAVLFMRDSLYLEELIDAVKTGHSGRIVRILKIYALSLRGSHRNQYAHELLRLIHHLEVVWPPELRDLIVQNWIVNPTGRPKSFVELDLVQEHFIFWIKKIYNAHGSNASWAWLAMISPCIAALRALAKDLNSMLGNYRSTQHTDPERFLGIQKVMDSLTKYNVYNIELGRTFDEKDKPVEDIESIGMAKVFFGNPNALDEYNKEFRT
ncbi:hypothetical protein BDV93DRAFT_429166, partial [Ceratobasidium sp. AG-I]